MRKIEAITANTISLPGARFGSSACLAYFFVAITRDDLGSCSSNWVGSERAAWSTRNNSSSLACSARLSRPVGPLDEVSLMEHD